MHVGLITFQTGHLKTRDVARRLLDHGHRVTVFAFPFKFRPPKIGPRRYQDRPWQLVETFADLRCAVIDYIHMNGWDDETAAEFFTGCDIWLHCTAKIIPKSFIEGRTILNCHPGLLPFNRGVDAFKRSIVEKWPVGITLHVIDEEIDRGTILCPMKVPIFETDELSDVCQRMYDYEIDLLGNFEHHLEMKRKGWAVGDDHPCSHIMIPVEQDQRLAEIFRGNRAELVRLSKEKV